MYAIELSGIHVKRLAKFTWTVGKRTVEDRTRITKVTHWPSGDVTVKLGDTGYRYPFNAEVKLLAEPYAS